MPYSFKKLADDWESLTDTEKISLFDGTDYNIATGAELIGIGEPFKVVIYDPVSSGQKLQVNAIPQSQLVLPKELIDTSAFAVIDSIILDCNISGSGIIRVAVTNNLSDYKVFNSGAGTWDNILPQDILTDGMTPSKVTQLLQSNWNLLNIEGGVAFAYVLDITNPTDEADMDSITFEGTMNDYYKSQVQGTVYDYEYVGDNVLRVRIYENGTYKINYKKKNDGGGGGGGVSIEEWKPNNSYTQGEFFTYNNAIYEVTADFTSGTTFDDTNCVALTGATATSSQIQALFI